MHHTHPQVARQCKRSNIPCYFTPFPQEFFVNKHGMPFTKSGLTPYYSKM